MGLLIAWAHAQGQMLHGIGLEPNEKFLRYRAGQVLVERLDGPVDDRATRGELVVKDRKGEITRRPKGWERFRRPVFWMPLTAFDFTASGKVVGVALTHAADPNPTGFLIVEDSTSIISTASTGCYAVAMREEHEGWCVGWDVSASAYKRPNYPLLRFRADGSSDSFLGQPRTRAKPPKGAPPEDSASMARRGVGLWWGPDGSIWHYVSSRGQLARFRPPADVRYFDLRRGEQTPYVNVAINPENRVIALLPVRAGTYSEDRLATRDFAIHELDQNRNLWTRVPGIPSFKGIWVLAGSDEEEFVLYSPRLHRLEWWRLPKAQ
jgi:hypothetical protein